MNSNNINNEPNSNDVHSNQSSQTDFNSFDPNELNPDCDDVNTQNQSGTQDSSASADPDNPQTDDILQGDLLAKKIEAALNAANDKYLRLLAEYDNFRKRSAKEKSDAYSDAAVDCISEILPVLDNFERALDNECADKSYKEGVEMIFNQFKSILAKIGVAEIEALGKPFDPNLHHAIKNAESDEFEENTVCEVFQKGYQYKDKIIRHSMVAVTL